MGLGVPHCVVTRRQAALSRHPPLSGRTWSRFPTGAPAPMSTVQEAPVKQIVLSTAAFGPAEIREITAAISNDYGKYRELREAVAELEEQESRTPATAARTVRQRG